MPHFDKLYETLKQLPVAPLAADVVKSVLAKNVTVLAAPTGSGKSMLVPAMLADASEDQVLVLVPRRFLATDAAQNVAAMAGCPLGKEVGYAIGQKNGEKSEFCDETKLLFATYGYAISSGLIKTAKNIVLDEVHEAAEDISLARAILHERKQKEPDLNLLEMSATINASKQAGYWKSVAQTSVHTVEGNTLACEERLQKPSKDTNIAQSAIDLLTKEDRNGIAIFRSGIKEVENTAEEIEEMLRAKGIRNVEVVQIYSNTPADEKEHAREAPKPGWKKIIVGTNVIESGVNLRWVDSGISDGMGKIPYDREDTGAHALVPEQLPQWRVVQQRGRINRDPAATGFDKGIFILHSNVEMEHRPREAAPELERCSLTRFAFHAASLKYVPEALQVDARIAPARWEAAHQDLMRLGLVKDDWSLTEDGEYVARLPLSPETGAMLCEARRIDIAAIRSGDRELMERPKLLPEAIILATLAETEGLRNDRRRGHGLEGKSDIHGASDLIDSMKVFMRLQYDPDAVKVAHPEETIAKFGKPKLQQAREKLKEKCTALNVHYNNFCDAMSKVDEIRARHKDANAIEIDTHGFDAERYNLLKQVILNGNVNRLFQLSEDGKTYRDLLRDYDGRKNDSQQPFTGYSANPYSSIVRKDSPRTPLLVGKLVEVPIRGQSEPEVIIDQPTSIPPEVFIAWAAHREPALLDDVKGKEKGKEQTELSARYAGCAKFTLPLPKKRTAVLGQQLRDITEKGEWVTAALAQQSGWRR